MHCPRAISRSLGQLRLTSLPYLLRGIDRMRQMDFCLFNHVSLSVGKLWVVGGDLITIKRMILAWSARNGLLGSEIELFDAINK